MSLSDGTLDPAFSASTTSYSASVANGVSTIDVTPTVADSGSTVTVDGVPATSGAASTVSLPVVGLNAIPVEVTASDTTTTQTYWVNVTRAAVPVPSTDAKLVGIGLSQGSLNETFASGTLSYTASIDNSTPSVRVTPYASDANASITVDGAPVTTGAQSGTITLTPGVPATVTIVVTPEDTNAPSQTYTLTITRAQSANADLSALNLSSGTLSPSFSGGTTSYTASVANSVASINMTPYVGDGTATVTVDGAAVTSGTASADIALTVNVARTVTVVVTAQNGATKTYTVDVTRALPPPASSDATLIGIGLSNSSLSPSFSTLTDSYTSSVGNSTPSTRVTPYASDTAATITVNGTAVASHTQSGAITLAVGDNPVTIVVTSPDTTTTKTYTLTVNRAPSSNADLAAIYLSRGSLSPSFASGTTGYTASVTGAASITVTPTVADPTATMTLNGVPFASGTTSADIPLAVGANTVTMEVTAQDGTTTKTYSVTVTRILSPDADLAYLSLSGAALSPSFASGTTGYTASVGNAIASIKATPTVSDATATVTVNGTPVASGAASTPIPLAVGANTITTEVTAEDSTTRTYTVTVTRAASTNAALSGLSLSNGTLSPSFASGTASYTASVANAETSLTVTPTVSDATAMVTVNGTPVASGAASATISLAVGANTITTEVTAEDGTTKQTYTVTVTRAASTDATLSGLSLSSGMLSPSFAVGTTGYTASVTNAETSLTVTPTVSDATATVTVNGTPVASGAASTPISLAVGANTITTEVTAEDGTTKQTYTVTVTRAAPLSVDATLSGLSLSSGTLSPSFASGTASYTASVTNTETSLTVTLTVSDANATVTVNGTPVASGAASTPISLAVGANTITTEVTAEDGTTKQTYTVTVTRAAPLSADASLSALSLSSGTLSPAFASGTASYTASVANAETSLTVTPTVSDATATVTVNGTPVASGAASAAISLAVGANTITTEVTAEDGTTKQTYTVTVTRAAAAVVVALSPAAGALPDATTGTAYSQTVTASGGTAPYGYTVTAGALPGGLTLDAVSGAIGGTPTAGGNSSFTVTATDANSATGATAYTLKVNAPAATFVFSPSGGALTEAMVGEDYRQSISATGGTGALLYSLASGSLPKGLVLNVSTGELTGPLAADAAAGNYAFTLQVTDGNGSTGSAAFTLAVKASAVTVANVDVDVPEGSTPNNVYLNRGATGGPFTGAELAFVEPANAGTATIIKGELAQAGPAATPAGWYLKFAPDPAYSGKVRVGYRLIGSLGVSNTGVVTYKLIHDASEVAADIDALVHGFVQTRQNLISSTIKVPGLLERRQMMQATDPVTARMTPSEDGMTASFSTSLNQMEAARDNADGADGGTPSPFNIWIDGALLAHKRDDNGNRWGSFAMINLGADYLLSERALIGLSFHYDRMTDPTDADAELTGSGWLAGPYASLEIARNIFWNASLRYGGSSNDIDTTFWDGSFDTTRWMADTSLEGQWNIDEDTILTPKLRVVYFSETVDDYAVKDAGGNTIAIQGFDEEQFRVSLGAEIARSFTLENGTKLTPKLGVTGGYSALDGTGAFASLTAGVSLETVDMWMLEASLLLNVAEEGETSAGGRVRAARQF